MKGQNNVEALIVDGKYSEALEVLYHQTQNKSSRWYNLESRILEKMAKYDEAKEAAKQAIKFALQEENLFDELSARISLLKTQLGLGQIDDMSNLIDSTDEFIDKHSMKDLIKCRRDIAHYINLKSGYHQLRGNNQKALDYALESLEIKQELGLKSEISRALNNIGTMYYNLGDFDLALNYYYESLEIKQEIGNPFSIAVSLHNIASLLRDRGEINTALKYYERSYELRTEFDNEEFLAYLLDNMGVLYHQKGQNAKALGYLQESLKLRLILDNEINIATAELHLAYVYISLKNYQEAEELLLASLKVQEAIGNEVAISNNLLHLIFVYVEQGDFESAEEYLVQIQELMLQSDQTYINLNGRIAEATIFSEQVRMNEKMKAQKIFEEISNQEVIDDRLAIYSTIKLSELLLLEYKSTEYGDLINQVDMLFNKLAEKVKKHNLWGLEIQIYFLKSRLNVIIGDLQKSNKYLDLANELIEEREMHHLKGILKSERMMMDETYNKWVSLIAKNTPLKEMFEESRIVDYMKEASQEFIKLLGDY